LWTIPLAKGRLLLDVLLTSDITKMGIGEVTIAVLPWLLTALGFLLTVTFVPDISLWLPLQPGLL
jgi:C4-dicarboxylate transporter, DctM subunit